MTSEPASEQREASSTSAPCGASAPSVGGQGFGQWHPPVGAVLLDRLRETGIRRPEVSAEKIERFRGHFEREVAAALTELPAADAPLVVTSNFLRSAAHRRHVAPYTDGPRSRALGPDPRRRQQGGDVTYAAARAALVGISFRRLVSTGIVGQPFDDGMAALEMCGQPGVVEWVTQLPPPHRTELRAEVDRLGRGLADRWPRLDPRWLPRTAVPMRVRLLDGAVILSCRPDLLVGWPDGREGSVGLVELSSGERQALDRTVLAFSVLVETLRSTAPPFVGATYYAQTGEIEVVPITYEVVEDAARAVVRAITTADDSETDDNGLPSARQVRGHRSDPGRAGTPTSHCALGAMHRARTGAVPPGDLRPPTGPPSPHRNRR